MIVEESKKLTIQKRIKCPLRTLKDKNRRIAALASRFFYATN